MYKSKISIPVKITKEIFVFFLPNTEIKEKKEWTRRWQSMNYELAWKCI